MVGHDYTRTNPPMAIGFDSRDLCSDRGRCVVLVQTHMTTLKTKREKKARVRERYPVSTESLITAATRVHG